MVTKIIWRLGKRLRIVRYLFWKLSGHRYLWGIVTYLDDHYEADPEPVTSEGVREASKWLDDHIDEIFPDHSKNKPS